MLLKDEVDLLRKVPLFAHLDPAKLKLLAFTSTRASFKPGQELFHQGDEGDAAYLILSGEADVIADTPSGEVPVATVGQNAVVGEIAILCEVPRTASVRAVSPLETLKIEKEHFLRLIREFPDMGVEIMRELGQRLTKTTAELSQARSALIEADS
jgi:CRP/FNR family transcriptional regulator, cyclic AMP receptor protein